MRDAAPRLGRGLASLLGELSPAAQANQPPQTGEISVELLDTNPFQPRQSISPETLGELVESIVHQGVLQPLLVRPHPTAPGRYQIVAGERRWRAARLAGLPSVPCHVRPLDDATITVAALVENLQRRDLNPIEEGAGYRRLMTDFAMTQEQLSAAIGKSRSHVANMLRLLHLPTSVQAHVQAGLLSAGHARAALAAPDPEAAAEAMIAGGLNVRQAEMLATTAASKATKPRAATRGLDDPDLQAVQADLSETLGMAVSIDFDGRSGNLRIRYRTLDQLDHLIARLGQRA